MVGEVLHIYGKTEALHQLRELLYFSTFEYNALNNSERAGIHQWMKVGGKKRIRRQFWEPIIILIGKVDLRNHQNHQNQNN